MCSPCSARKLCHSSLVASRVPARARMAFQDVSGTRANDPSELLIFDDIFADPVVTELDVGVQLHVGNDGTAQFADHRTFIGHWCPKGGKSTANCTHFASQRRRAEIALIPHQIAGSAPFRRSPVAPVTPEAAGSSPVAPVLAASRIVVRDAAISVGSSSPLARRLGITFGHQTRWRM